MQDRILYYAIKYNGDYTKIKNALFNNEEYKKIKYQGKYLTICDEKYPECFRQLKYKPWILFYKGDIHLLEEKMIGVVGSRQYSAYGETCTVALLAHLNKNYGIVSGLAKGIDAIAHVNSLKQNRKTIAVIGCGIDYVYPKENKELYKQIEKEGLIISEYPYSTKPFAHRFPWRNRLIAALSSSLIVIEAKKRSGTLITVNEALELGKDIYCFPHPFCSINGEGCNALIQQGSAMIKDIKDIQDI